ncbi:hypothetical protein JCM10135_10170 [Stetteria hydrogenophila]
MREALRELGRHQSRLLILLLSVLALALALPEPLSGHEALTLIAEALLLAVSAALALEVFQATIWAAFLGSLLRHLAAGEEAFKEYCGGRKDLHGHEG